MRFTVAAGDVAPAELDALVGSLRPPDEDAWLLLEGWPGVELRPFAQPPASSQPPSRWSQGRVFWREGELRWRDLEAAQARFRLVYSGEGSCPLPQLAPVDPPLELGGQEDREVIVRGARRVELPGQLAGLVQAGRLLVIQAREYLDRDADVALARLCGVGTTARLTPGGGPGDDDAEG